jgi:hypothetical protein
MSITGIHFSFGDAKLHAKRFQCKTDWFAILCLGERVTSNLQSSAGHIIFIVLLGSRKEAQGFSRTNKTVNAGESSMARKFAGFIMLIGFIVSASANKATVHLENQNQIHATTNNEYELKPTPTRSGSSDLDQECEERNSYGCEGRDENA